MPQYSIDPRLKQPAYLQLYLQIREDITGGICPYGSKLPSKRFLAAETGTSVITVQHAYDLLADEGYIESRERSGFFVSYREHDLFPVASAVEESAVADMPGLLDRSARVYLLSHMTAGEILEQQVAVEGNRLYGDYICLEMIGQNRYEEFTEQDGKIDGENG